MKTTGGKGLAVLLCFLLILSTTPPVIGQAAQAGQVSAQIPQARLERPGARLTAASGLPVYWDDLVVTEPDGRVRITLGDGSILNVGSNSSLRVQTQNPQTRASDLTLSYGRMRVRVPKLGAGQSFQVKTNTAVLGVIGTDFFVQSEATQTYVIVYEGVLHITHINPVIGGSAHLLAGQKITVGPSQPPPAPQNASPGEVQDSVQDTNVGEDLPQPQVRQHPPGKPPWAKWWVWALVAGAVTLSIVVPAVVDDKPPPLPPAPPPCDPELQSCVP